MKKYIRVVNGPIQIGDKVFNTKQVAHADADEANALVISGYAKHVSDEQGQKETEAADKGKRKPEPEPEGEPEGKK